MKRTRAFLRDETGATAVEYALLASLVAGMIVLLVGNLGTEVQALYEKARDCFP